MFLAKLAAQSLLIEGADVDNAYQYVNMDKLVIMRQATDCSGIINQPGKVCIVLRLIYGARQVGKI